MKIKMHRLIGLFLCCVMLVGLLPLTSFAADAGYTKNNPIKVTTYAELKSALENYKISYIFAAVQLSVSRQTITAAVGAVQL